MVRGIMALVLLGWSLAALGADIQKDNPLPQVELNTNMGKIVLELNRRKAPISVDNFLTYVVDGDYDNSVFHRLIANFVLQGGGLDSNMKPLSARKAIVNESGNGLSNVRGSIAMARVNDPHSATRQFYINLNDNTNLDPSPKRWGYAVFGEVIGGIEVVEAMEKVATAAGDVPLSPLILTKANLLSQGN